MKLHRATPEAYIFRCAAREQELLQEVLALYPLVPASHHRLTKNPAAQSTDNQHLLAEALAERRTLHRRQLTAWLAAPGRFEQRSNGIHLTIPVADLELLLQALNDVRVGSWLALGEPDETQPPEITPENFRYAVALEVAGAFQSVLLAALGETQAPDWVDD